MIIDVKINEKHESLALPDKFISDASAMFLKMDNDMDKGWQLKMNWIESPDLMDRCKIAMYKFNDALEKDDPKTASLMLGYVVYKMPEIKGVHLEFDDEESTINFYTDQGLYSEQNKSYQKMDDIEVPVNIQKRANDEVTRIYKTGRNFRFSALDKNEGRWVESEAIKDESLAQQLREKAYKERIASLMQT